MSFIPPVLSTTNRPNCCHPSAPLKDAVFSSADIKRDLSACKMRAECAAIVNLRSDRIVANDIVTNTLMVTQLLQPPPALGNFAGTGDQSAFQVTAIDTWEVFPAAILSWSIDGMANQAITEAVSEEGSSVLTSKYKHWSEDPFLFDDESVTWPRMTAK